MASSRSIRPLVYSWVAYWAGLAAVKLGPAAVAIWRATRGAPDTASVGVNYGDGRFSLTVIQSGATTFSGSVSLLALALWIAGPPILAWVVWAAQRRKEQPVSA